MKREPKDAGLGTGVPKPEYVEQADLDRGYSKVQGEAPSPIEMFVETSRGFLTRPGGWER